MKLCALQWELTCINLYISLLQTIQPSMGTGQSFHVMNLLPQKPPHDNYVTPTASIPQAASDPPS